MISKTERKRIFESLFSQFREELTHIRIYLATGSRVVIRFAGIYEDFRFSEGQVYRLPSNADPDQEDADVLFALAKDISAAVQAGYVKPHIDTEALPLFEDTDLDFTQVIPSTREKVKPPRISNKTKKRTPGALQNARHTLLYELYKNKSEDNNLTVHKSTAEEIDIRLVDAVHHLSFEHGVAVHDSGGKWISREMFAFLCCFAKDVTTAVLRGYQSTNPEKERVQSDTSQMELPLWQEPT